MSTRAPSTLSSEWRSSGSNRVSVPGPTVDRLAARADRDLALEHGDPRVLLHLVLAERLAGAEHDQDGASAIVRVEHDRVARPFGSIESEQVPALHQKEAYPRPDTLKRC